MGCREVQQKLDLFARQEVTAFERESIEAHLQSCEACRQSLQRLRELEQVLAVSPAPPVPDGFAARVVAMAERQQATPRRTTEPSGSSAHRIRLTAATIAALAAGLLVGLFMGHQTWQSGSQRSALAATQSADPLAASGFQQLAEPAGESLAESYLRLTVMGDRQERQIMWKTTRPYLIIASLSLNLAFVGMWLAHASPIGTSSRVAGPVAQQQEIWCPLHRELRVTGAQWTKIEPGLREFQAAVGRLWQKTDAKREEVIELIAADNPDLDKILAKQAEVLATKQQIQRLVVEHLLAEKEVLTPEQQRQLFTMLRDRTSCATGPPLSGMHRDGAATIPQTGQD